MAIGYRSWGVIKHSRVSASSQASFSTNEFFQTIPLMINAVA